MFMVGEVNRADTFLPSWSFTISLIAKCTPLLINIITLILCPWEGDPMTSPTHSRCIQWKSFIGRRVSCKRAASVLSLQVSKHSHSLLRWPKAFNIPCDYSHPVTAEVMGPKTEQNTYCRVRLSSRANIITMSLRIPAAPNSLCRYSQACSCAIMITTIIPGSPMEINIKQQIVYLFIVE